MKHKKFGTTGHDVSVIGQGTWYIDHGDRKSAVAALRRGIDLGIPTSIPPKCMAMRSW
jgi:diketogulonate reductase-like aldo/keto reductase